MGATGWATGPHLHFEFRVDGQHQDPMVIARQREAAAPVSAAARPAFDRLPAPCARAVLGRASSSRPAQSKAPLPAAVPKTTSDLYIGLMSGTSLDGVDAVLADFSAALPGAATPRPWVLTPTCARAAGAQHQRSR